MPIPGFDSIPDAQTNLNFKMYTDASAAVPLLASQNGESHSNRCSIFAENLMAMAGKAMHTVDPIESASALKLLTGNDLAAMVTAIAAGQQATKGAQTVPPITSPLPVT